MHDQEEFTQIFIFTKWDWGMKGERVIEGDWTQYLSQNINVAQIFFNIPFFTLRFIYLNHKNWEYIFYFLHCRLLHPTNKDF